MVQPVHILNLRESPAGGGVLSKPHLPRPSSSRLVMLIHGYNDVLMDARLAYAAFLNPSYDDDLVRGLPPNAWPAYVQQLQGDTLDALSQYGEVCLVVWPGDILGRGLSAVAYADAVTLAEESARVLADWLEEFAQAPPGNPPVEVTLICHSLGNRLALELLHCFVSRGTPIVCSVMCMMAAAVAVTMVNGAATKPTPNLEVAVHQVGKQAVLFSGDDSVLAWGFPAGEWDAGEGWRLEAIGHAGDPAHGLWTERYDMRPYGHGGYWTANASASGTTSRDVILRFLGQALPRQVASSAVPAHSLPPASAIAENAIAPRIMLTRQC